MSDETKTPTTEIEAFGEAMSDFVFSLPEQEKFKKAKALFLDSIWEDMEYSVIDQMPETIEGFVRRMAENTVKEMLEGRDDQVRRYLSLDGYTGRDRDHPVIHGKLFETGAIALRKKIAQAHADLIQNERIKDLECQVESLVSQINDRDRQIEFLREERRQWSAP